ncbi:phage baseplate assembly protein V [Kribbella sp. NPDC055110]
MGLLDLLDGADARSTDSKRHGVVRAVVTDNFDLTMQGRVKVKFPTIPDIEPWAPVCTPFAGDGYGLYCMPQIDDVVIVAFENGDLTWPVVVGSVWDVSNRPPIDLPLDARNKRVLKTPGGHEVVLDDLELEITVTHIAGHKLTMTARSIAIELAEGLGSLTLALPGKVELKGAVQADVSAKNTTVKGEVNLGLSGASASLQADATCQVKGGLVTIN